MTSLALIPKDLIDTEKYHPFLNWLFKHHLSWTDTRAYLRMWSHATGYKLKASDWSAIEQRWITTHARS